MRWNVQERAKRVCREPCNSLARITFFTDCRQRFVRDVQRGLIVPKFGNKLGNRVIVSMTFEVLSELLLITKAHYNAWLCTFYMSQPTAVKGSSNHAQNQTSAVDIDSNGLF